MNFFTSQVFWKVANALFFMFSLSLVVADLQHGAGVPWGNAIVGALNFFAMVVF